MIGLSCHQEKKNFCDEIPSHTHKFPRTQTLTHNKGYRQLRGAAAQRVRFRTVLGESRLKRKRPDQC